VQAVASLLTDSMNIAVICSSSTSIFATLLALNQYSSWSSLALSLILSCFVYGATAITLGAEVCALSTWKWALIQAGMSNSWLWKTFVEDTLASTGPLRITDADYAAAAAALCGSWIGACFVPYDWGYEWQIWPTPSLCGAAVLYWGTRFGFWAMKFRFHSHSQ
jgi:hypothetical protein